MSTGQRRGCLKQEGAHIYDMETTTSSIACVSSLQYSGLLPAVLNC
jgi:hypothetical protein